MIYLHNIAWWIIPTLLEFLTLYHVIFPESNMQAFVDITLVLLIASGICQLQARFIVVDNSNEGRTTVPQDADVNVQDFQLAENNIEEIDNSSFVRYTNMLKLNLDRNPLKIIGENTFTQNKLFWSFHCNECNIQRLPEKFGIFPKIKIMLLRKGIDSSITPTILRYPYFEAFTSLDYFILTHIPLKNADIIKLPSSIKFLTMANTEFTAFPKLPSSLYPVLIHINLYNNPQIKHIPDDVWGNISDALIVFRADGNGLSTVGDLTQKQNLKTIDISRNHLETVPDLLNMSLLIGLKIGRNSRMSCDSRMCWRRLWDRMRVPLVSSDDVQCRQPPALVGYKLSEVNPKVMGCMEGIVRSFIFGA